MELRKLQAEIAKLSAEAHKLYWNNLTDWIAPTVSIFTILMLAVTIRAQRRTALDVRHILELKIAEFIMTSRTPGMARQRAALLSTLYQGGISKEFLNVVKAKADQGEFPGDLGFALRTTVFEQTAPKYADPRDIVELARRMFTGDEWLKKLDAPQATVVAVSADKGEHSVPEGAKGKQSS